MQPIVVNLLNDTDRQFLPGAVVVMTTFWRSTGRKLAKHSEAFLCCE